MTTDLQAPAPQNPAPQPTSIEKIPEPADNLSSDQHTILEAFTVGHTISSAARLHGIARTTIYRWIKTDPHFRALHNQWLDSIRQSCKSRLVDIAEQATLTVESAIKHGDAKIATQILKGMGFLTGQSELLLCQPEQVQRDDLIKKLEDEIDDLQRELKALRRKAELLGPGAAATWSVVPKAVAPHTVVELYHDLIELRRPFSTIGKFEEPWILIQCLDRDDQIIVVNRLTELGHEATPLHGFDKPIDPDALPDPDEPGSQDIGNWCAPEELILAKS